jgi:7-carboxy-7-deazaguanine synthase
VHLRITEIFYSLQGETRTVGLPTVFIRLTGCPLRCQYCDTSYAFQGGTQMSLDEILQTVKAYQPRYITVTGGEPLAQKNCHSLLSKLCDEGYSVSLETSGALDISEVDRRVVVVMDIKTPGSGELMRNKWENLTALKATDQIKFIICHREDYEWSKEILERHQLAEICEILLSPSHGELENQQLASWILADNLPVRFQLQLHKYIWGDLPGY